MSEQTKKPTKPRNTNARKLASAKVEREQILDVIDQTRATMRLVRQSPNQRQESLRVVQEAQGELRALDRRIFWLQNPDTPEPDVAEKDDESQDVVPDPTVQAVGASTTEAPDEPPQEAPDSAE